MKIAAYDTGADDALDTFGIRLAGDLMRRRMPVGPSHLGAERLSKMLSAQVDTFSKKPVDRRLNKERPILWGPRVSVDDGVPPPHTGV